MGIPVIIVLISFIVQGNAQLGIIQTNPEFDGQLIGSGGDFGVDGFLSAFGLPLLGLLLLLGLTGGGARAVPAPTPTPTPSIPCPPCPNLPTTACPTPAVCTPTPACPPGFQRLPGILTKCYRATAPVANYYRAEAACYAMGGNLAEFTNAGEQAAVQTFVNVLGVQHYVGYNDCEMAGTLVGDNSRTIAAPNFPAGGGCGTLNVIPATPTAVVCTTALPGICEARTDPAAVRCVCA